MVEDNVKVVRSLLFQKRSVVESLVVGVPLVSSWESLRGFVPVTFRSNVSVVKVRLLVQVVVAVVGRLRCLGSCKWRWSVCQGRRTMNQVSGCEDGVLVVLEGVRERLATLVLKSRVSVMRWLLVVRSS